jgi:WD40 repeat protein
VAIGALSDGTPVVVSGSDDRTIRLWHLHDGTPLGRPIAGHEDAVTAVAVGALSDGTPVVVSGSDDRTMRLWHLDDGRSLAPPLPAAITAVAIGEGTIVACHGAEIALHEIGPVSMRPEQESVRTKR